MNTRGIIIGIVAIIAIAAGSYFLFFRQTTDEMIRSKKWTYMDNLEGTGRIIPGYEKYYRGSEDEKLFVTDDYSTDKYIGKLLDENTIEWYNQVDGTKHYWKAEEQK